MDRIEAEKCKQSDKLADGAFEELVNLGLSYAPHSIIGIALGKLKAYEDTGLTPEQVRELQEKQDKAIERLEDFQNIVGYDLLTVQACIRIVREAV